MKSKFLLMVLALTSWVSAQEIGFIETFSLAADRAEALKELVPGTDDFYYYHALHAQQVGEAARFEALITQWVRERNGNTPDRARELLNRQALLDYDKNPRKSLDYLLRHASPSLYHQRKTSGGASNLPTTFDNAEISTAKMLARALAQNERSLGGIEDVGLWLVAGRNITPDQRRNLLARLKRPDFPDLVDLILADLSYRDSRGFGSLEIHKKLTVAQLEELVRKRPALLNEIALVNLMLAKLAPDNDVLSERDLRMPPAGLDNQDFARDPEELKAYLERLWAFASRLDPVHNTLKANILYSRMQFDKSQGIYDRARFMEYIKLPRNVPTILPAYRERVPHRNQLAELNRNTGLVALPPVPADEPLVTEFLLEFFKTDPDFKEFAPYLRDDYLKRLFAESKIVNGIGDPAQWAPMLAPEEFRRIKERVDIEFAPSNPKIFGVGDAVALDVFVKNVPELTVNIFEINTFNYYREHQKPISTAIELDGLVASVTRSFKYADVSERRVLRTIEIPEAAGRGVYVVELIGNGRSSRALVQKGWLTAVEEMTAAGQAFTLLDESGQRVLGGRAWVEGHELLAGKDGRITVPFSTAERTIEPRLDPFSMAERTIEPRRDSSGARSYRLNSGNILFGKDGFTTLSRFDHAREVYSLKANAYVDREALIRRERALLIARPSLQVSGAPISVGLLEEPRLVVRTVDLRGISATKTIGNLVLTDTAELVQEIAVPEGVVQLTVELHAKMSNISQGRKDELSDAAVFVLNGIEKTQETDGFLLGRHAGGYTLDLRGRNGEPLGGMAVTLHLKHRLFSQRYTTSVQTDAMGRVALGALENIEDILVGRSSQPPTMLTLSKPEAYSYPDVINGTVGSILRVPITWQSDNLLEEVSLLELRHDQFTRDWKGALRTADGFIEIENLPAGDFELHLGPVRRAITLRLTEAPERDGMVVSNRRALKLPLQQPLRIASITPGEDALAIQLVNAGALTRVHVVASRFEPEYDLFGRLDFEYRQPFQTRVRPSRALYESGRDLGDEYRYILDRQKAPKFLGNMLERPGLLLNPWALRTTEADTERLQAGGAYAGRAEGLAEPAAGGRGRFRELLGSAAGRTLNSYDFLAQPSVFLPNLAPDETGRVSIPMAQLKGLPLVRVLAVSAADSALRSVALADTPMERRERRLVNNFNPKLAITEQKRITSLALGESVTVPDMLTARFERFDTVAKVYHLMSTLNPDKEFAEFAFVARWPELDAAEQRRLYSKYASHELSFFLYNKDRKFFDAVVAPYLANKKDKTFMDHWLLGDDVTRYLEPWHFGRLNAAERALLARRVEAAQAGLIARDADERVVIQRPDVEAFNQRFDTALQVDALDSAAASAGENLRASAMNEQSAFEDAETVKSPIIMRGIMGAREASGAVGRSQFKPAPAAAPMADAAPARQKEEAVKLAEALGGSLADMRSEREAVRRFFKKLDKTEELAENNYWHLPIEKQVAELVKINRFWADYAAHDDKTPFLSAAFTEATTSLTEMMLALAVLDVPFTAGEHTEKTEGVSYTLTAGTPLLFLHREARQAERSGEPNSILVAQRFFRADDRERVEDGERFDKLVTEEFLPQVVYGAQVVLTNPAGNRQKVHALTQIPAGALQIGDTLSTRSHYYALEPFSTRTLEYFFYFPETGDFPHYPVTVATGETVTGQSAPFSFHVVKELTQIDKTSWAWISQNGSEQDVLDFLNAANLPRIEGQLEEIAWRMRNKAFFEKAIPLLESRRIFNTTLWGYALQHGELGALREYLRHVDFAKRCGLWLQSTPLTLDPVERFDYQHLEYAPLVNPRAHQVGAKRTILNQNFREQYQRFMKVLSYKARLDNKDKLAVAFYMMLQDRLDEAVAWFAQVDRATITERLQYDYLDAYLALSRGDAGAARKAAAPHATEAVDRWRDRFAQVLGLLDQVEGRAGAQADPEKRDQAMAALAATEPALELHVESSRIRLDTRNLDGVTLNFYPMDIELLFSRSPFLKEDAARFDVIRPVLSREVRIRAGAKEPTELDLPAEFRSRNVMVEAVAAGLRKTQAYYANTLKVQVVENYGQVVVNHASTGKAVPGAYVKVYARRKNGEVKFFKDGYTDLLGRFDYASLNTNEMEDTERLALLVLSPEFGAVVREASPPKQ